MSILKIEVLVPQPVGNVEYVGPVANIKGDSTKYHIFGVREEHIPAHFSGFHVAFSYVGGTGVCPLGEVGDTYTDENDNTFRVTKIKVRRLDTLMDAEAIAENPRLATGLLAWCGPPSEWVIDRIQRESGLSNPWCWFVTLEPTATAEQEQQQP